MTADSEGFAASLTPLEAQLIRGEDSAERTRLLFLPEHTLKVRLDGQPWKSIVCTRGNLREMLIGQLYTQRLIDAVSEIGEIRFSPDEDRAEVRLSAPHVQPRPLRRTEQAPPWERKWIFDLSLRLGEGMPIHRQTFAVHCAFLACGGELLYACEDISRHNAVDKVLGRALLEGAELARCMLFTSGRVPADMAEKAVAAGVPLLVSKANPTADAVRLAKEYGLTLICCAREDSFVLF